MSIFSSIVNFVSGGIGENIVNAVKDYFPPKMSQAEKEQLEMQIRQAAHNQEIELLKLAQEEQLEFNKRIRDMEGTAKDLQEMGIVGKIVIFLRGAQRPIWGYFVLYMDIMVFSNKWNLAIMQERLGAQSAGLDLQSAFWIINILVLGFLFGERAVRNVVPLIKNMSKNKAEG